MCSMRFGGNVVKVGLWHVLYGTAKQESFVLYCVVKT